nr:hypothetical protein [Luteitalea sp.]
MPVDAEQRELLAQLLRVPVVDVDIDRALEQERLVQTVELLLNGFGLACGARKVGTGRLLAGVPDLEDRFLQQPHVAGSRLQSGQLLLEQRLEPGLGHVDAAAAGTAVVVGVVAASPLRPAAGETAATGLASYEATQREIRVPLELRRQARRAARQHGLHAIEIVLTDQRLEVSTPAAHPVLGDVDDAGVELVAQQHPDRLRAERLAAPVAQSPGRHLL